MAEKNVLSWSSEQVGEWAKRKHLNNVVLSCIYKEDIDGKCLLSMNESDIRDLRDKYMYELKVGDIKRFWIAVRCLQRDNPGNLVYLGCGVGGSVSESSSVCSTATTQQQQQHVHSPTPHITAHYQHQPSCDLVHHLSHDIERVSPPLSVDGRATSIQPEFFKTMISLGMYILNRNVLFYFLKIFIL